MMNSTEDPSWDQDIIRSGKSLRRSLQSVLSGSGCNEAPAHVASLSTAQWNISKTAQTSNVLPRCLERHLSEALDAAPRTDDDLISILAELSTLLPHLPWINRQARADQDSAFVERHRHGMIAGPGALFECSTLTLGLALMMPKTSYPITNTRLPSSTSFFRRVTGIGRMLGGGVLVRGRCLQSAFLYSCNEIDVRSTSCFMGLDSFRG